MCLFEHGYTADVIILVSFTLASCNCSRISLCNQHVVGNQLNNSEEWIEFMKRIRIRDLEADVFFQTSGSFILFFDCEKVDFISVVPFCGTTCSEAAPVCVI